MIKHLLTAVLIFNSLLPAQIASLKDTTNQFDYVIITIPEFSEYCSVFRLHKEFNRGLRVFVADTAQIYREFTDKKTKQENIREFISYAGTYWHSPQPKYFLILGDVTMIPNFEFVSIPNYPNTDTSRSDFFYSESIYDNDSLTDFCVGRVAAGNGIEIQNYFNKVMNYESENITERWNNRFSVIADNGFCPNRNDGDIYERSAMRIGEEIPDYMEVKYFFESEESRYYADSDSVINFLNKEGSSCIYFMGRGNSEIFTCDTMFNIESFNNLENAPKYFVASFLCAQIFSNGNSTSMLDRMLLSESGAIAGFNSVGLSYFDRNLNTTNNFFQDLYSQRETAIGEIARTILSESYNDIKKFNLFGDPSLIIKYDITTSVRSFTDKIPDSYDLYQNYPNPFNPATTIKFIIPKSGNIKLQVYDMLGRKIKTLIDGNIEAGYHLIRFDGSNLGSGVYLYELNSSSFNMVRKMLLIK